MSDYTIFAVESSNGNGKLTNAMFIHTKYFEVAKPSIIYVRRALIDSRLAPDSEHMHLQSMGVLHRRVWSHETITELTNKCYFTSFVNFTSLVKTAK